MTLQIRRNPCPRYPWGNEPCPSATVGGTHFSHDCEREKGHRGACRCSTCGAAKSTAAPSVPR